MMPAPAALGDANPGRKKRQDAVKRVRFCWNRIYLFDNQALGTTLRQAWS